MGAGDGAGSFEQVVVRAEGVRSSYENGVHEIRAARGAHVTLERRACRRRYPFGSSLFYSGRPEWKTPSLICRIAAQRFPQTNVLTQTLLFPLA